MIMKRKGNSSHAWAGEKCGWVSKLEDTWRHWQKSIFDAYSPQQYFVKKKWEGFDEWRKVEGGRSKISRESESSQWLTCCCRSLQVSLAVDTLQCQSVAPILVLDFRKIEGNNQNKSWLFISWFYFSTLDWFHFPHKMILWTYVGYSHYLQYPYFLKNILSVSFGNGGMLRSDAWTTRWTTQIEQQIRQWHW